MAGSTRKVEKIVIGIDGSPQSDAALEWAIGLAKPLGAEVIAVYALPQPNLYEYGYGYGTAVPVELDPKWQADMKDLFESQWCSALDKSAVRAKKLVETGRPASVIAAAAEKADADLVVVGRSGRGGVAELLLGSVSHELSHHCRRPVVLISGPAAATQGVPGNFI